VFTQEELFSKYNTNIIKCTIIIKLNKNGLPTAATSIRIVYKQNEKKQIEESQYHTLLNPLYLPMLTFTLSSTEALSPIYINMVNWYKTSTI